MGAKIIAWIRENYDRLLVLTGVLLVGVLAFEAGLIKGEMRQSRPLVLSIPREQSALENDAASSKDLGNNKIAYKSSGVEPVVATVSGGKGCLLVGSKNSDKYHLATCTVVKRIKPENRVCFSSKEEAEKRGYVAGCLK